MTTISLCMIVKNEEAVLARCLDSIAPLMDEIIIVDTGSSDRTIQIASAYTDKIYSYAWTGDFSDARNYAFSKASKDYIYSADADEVLDQENQHRFALLKDAMMDEIEIVQMKYVTGNAYNTVLNYQEEYRPKLFRRMRKFTWIDPIHETVRTEPVVYNSDIEILHLPTSMHQKRDFQGFLHAWQQDQALSPKLHNMYAKELLMNGHKQDFIDALPVFLQTMQHVNQSDILMKEASCVLAHTYRLQKQDATFFKYVLKDMLTDPCSDICYELGEYYFAIQDYNEASLWYYNACHETTAILNVHTAGDLSLKRLADCYKAMADELQVKTNASASKSGQEDNTLANNYLQMAQDYLSKARDWELPHDPDVC